MTTDNVDNEEELPSDPFLGKETLPESTITPDYLADERPQSDSRLDYLKWCLVHQFNEANLLSDGHPQKLIDQAAFELERDGYRQRPSKKQILESFMKILKVMVKARVKVVVRRK
jgi:hypothetical protein